MRIHCSIVESGDISFRQSAITITSIKLSDLSADSPLHRFGKLLQHRAVGEPFRGKRERLGWRATPVSWRSSIARLR
jgi:hypothetical protein